MDKSERDKLRAFIVSPAFVRFDARFELPTPRCSDRPQEGTITYPSPADLLALLDAADERDRLREEMDTVHALVVQMVTKLRGSIRRAPWRLPIEGRVDAL